jgi:hypothetical protein
MLRAGVFCLTTQMSLSKHKNIITCDNACQNPLSVNKQEKREKEKEKTDRERERERERERDISWSCLFPVGIITFGPHSLLLLRAYMLHSPDFFQRNAASFHPHHLLTKTHDHDDDDDDLHRLSFAIVVTSENQLLQKENPSTAAAKANATAQRDAGERGRERQESGCEGNSVLCLERHRQRPQRADSRTVPQSAEQPPQTAEQNPQSVEQRSQRTERRPQELNRDARRTEQRPQRRVP